MGARVTLFAADCVDGRHAETRDSSNERYLDLVSVEFDLLTGMQGTLADLLTVIGRAHEQLLAIEAARAEAAELPARAVLGTDGSLRLETAQGHGIGWLSGPAALDPANPGDELLIEPAGTGWGLVEVEYEHSREDELPDGYVVVPVVELGEEGTDG